MTRLEFLKPDASVRAAWMALGFVTQALVFLSLAVGLLVPLYSDEIATHMSRARFLLDEWQVLNLYPQCRQMITAGLQASLVPGAVLYSTLYSVDSAFGLRLLGILVAGAWLAMLWWWGGKLSDKAGLKTSVRVLLLCLSAMGSLPMIMILTRTEQFQALCLMIFCLVPLYFSKTGESSAWSFCKLVGLLVLYSALLYIHPKSVFFAPFAMVALWASLGHAHWGLRAGAAAVSVAMLLQVVPALFTATACDNVPSIAKVLSGNVIDMRGASDPFSFIGKLFDNLQAALYAVPARVEITANPQSFWIARPQFVDGGLTGFLLVGSIVKQLYFVLLVLIPLLTLAPALWALAMRRLRIAHVLATALLAGLLGHAAIYSPFSWHFYTPGLIVPCLVMLMALAGTLLRDWLSRYSWVVTASALGCMALFLASAAQLVLHQLPALIDARQSSGYTVPGQPISTPTLLSDAAQLELERLAASCNLGKATTPHAAVDGVGYFYLLGSRAPMNALYVFDFGYGNTVGDTRQFLKSMESGGVLARCDYIPDSLKGMAKVSGEMCCLAAEK